MYEKTVCELFAGIGGFRLGLEEASKSDDTVPWKTVFMNQWEPEKKNQDAFECYRIHFGSDKDCQMVNQDIAEVDKNDIPDHTLLVGGFPCQDYSVAHTGAKGMEGKKGVLWWQIYETIHAKHPKYVLLENVDRLLKSPGTQRGRDFGIILACFQKLGYRVEWRVINAADYGYPQRRRRVFIFATDKSEPFAKRMLETQPRRILLSQGFFAKSFPVKTIKESSWGRLPSQELQVISDTFTFPFESAGTFVDGMFFTGKAIPNYLGHKTTLREILDDEASEDAYPPFETLRKIAYAKSAKKIERTSQAGYTYEFSEGAVPFPDSIDEPARTLLTSESGTNRTTHVIRDPYTDMLRLLTPEETEAIQGFPKGWTNTGMSGTMRYFCTGNALVVGLVKRMGQMLDAILEDEASLGQPLRVADLFSGCGGMTLGFKNAGFHIAASFDAWDKAVECHKANFNHPVRLLNLSNVEQAVECICPLKPDVIIGGPPCQDFSHAGNRVEADRAALTDSYAEIVSAVRPRYFVMENVGHAQTSQAFQKAKRIFKEAGYGLTMMLLDASHCGAPQKRQRFFCIGALGEHDGFLQNRLVRGLSTTPMTLHDYAGDSLGFQYYYGHPRNYQRKGIFSIDEPAPTIRGINRPLPPGYPGHPNDACPVSESVHSLTTKERALIQTFPENFRWTGSKTDIEQMIGNAVPVKLAEYVARTLMEFIRKREGEREEKPLTLGSLFDGIGGWQIAAKRSGIRPVWSSEIEKFPLRVTKKWFPETKQLGDITKLDGKELPIVDIICAGSPCQDLSVSGRREGLAGERSGLFANAIQIFHQMRERTGYTSPRFFVWENVVGAFSSNHGQDFRAVLESIGQTCIPMPESGKWANAGMVRMEACDICWRVLDAKYWGVPQSRKRVFLIADFRAYGRRAGEILFKSESMCGHPSSEQKLQSEATKKLGGGSSKTNNDVEYFSQQRFGVYREDETSACLAHRDYKGTRDLIVGAVAARDYKGVGSQYVSEGKCQVQGGRVRRLTPLECERLQGLPNGWTAMGNDAERLKAIGNGMAQPCADFVMAQIARYARQ